jgi:cystathionine beta-lyase/cystathionine gamma-synthase
MTPILRRLPHQAVAIKTPLADGLRFIRVSAGIEDASDLVADLDQAFGA